VEALWKQEGAKSRKFLTISAKTRCQIITHNALKRCGETNFCEFVRGKSKQNMSALVRTGSGVQFTSAASFLD